MAMVRFSMRWNGDSGSIAEVVRLAQVAEEAGFDDVWYCQDLMKRDAWVALTAIALHTTRVRVGTALVNPYSCDPAELAMKAVTLQEVSGGRFVLGIGAGEQSYLRWIGRDETRPASGVREAVRRLRLLLAGASAQAEGDVLSPWTAEARLRCPIPTPIVPIYIGGQGPVMLRMMGEVADGGLPILFPPAGVHQVVRHIHEGAVRAGRDSRSIDVSGCIWYALAENRATAHDALRPLIAYYGPALRADILSPIGLTPDDFSSIARAQRLGQQQESEHLVTDRMLPLAIVGTPDDVVPQLVRLVQAGVTNINIGPPLGPDPEQVIRMTGSEVIPAVRFFTQS